jgi:hypothetical protein
MATDAPMQLGMVGLGRMGFQPGPAAHGLGVGPSVSRGFLCRFPATPRLPRPYADIPMSCAALSTAADSMSPPLSSPAS